MKKQILTFVALAAIAIGGAIATTNAGTLNVKESDDFTSGCKDARPCHVSDIATCTIAEVDYVGSDDQPLGSCSQPMELYQ